MIAKGRLFASRRPPRVVNLVWVLTALVFVAASCGQSGSALPDSVVAEFDIENNSIADISDGQGLESVSRTDLLAVVGRAQQAGTDLRIVVAGPDDEFVSAESVVDRYGGSALAYQIDSNGFDAASRDMSGDQLNEAVEAAVNGRIAESASAFVGVVETFELSAPGASNRAWLLWLLVPSAAFMLWGAWSYFQARNRRIKRRVGFDERKWVLADWASQLGPELESLRPLVAVSPDPENQLRWQESDELVRKVVPALESATSIGELDAAEIRIGRTAIKLRDLRASLSG